ncbi:hypothetical protein [Pseudomonas mosselii]
MIITRCIEAPCRLDFGRAILRQWPTWSTASTLSKPFGRRSRILLPATLTDEMMVLNALTPLLDYLLTLSPVLGLFAVWFWVTPCSLMGLRLAILLTAFLLTRDLMTPCGLWRVGGKPALQFHANVWILTSLGIGFNTADYVPREASWPALLATST